MQQFFGRVTKTNPDHPDRFVNNQVGDPFHLIKAENVIAAVRTIVGDWDHGEFEVMRGEISVEVLIHPVSIPAETKTFWVFGLDKHPFYQVQERSQVLTSSLGL